MKIKYCKKNQGSKLLYHALSHQYPDMEHKYKSCLDECGLCRERPFVKLGKRKLVHAGTPERLYMKINQMLKS